MGGESRPRDSGQSIEDAVEREDVSFPQLFTAMYRQYRGEPDEREYWRKLYPDAHAAFEKKHGTIERSWFANEFAAGAAITSAGELLDDVWFNELSYDTSAAAGLWAELRELRDRIDINLAGDRRDREICVRGLYHVFTGLISALVVEWHAHEPDQPTDGKQLAAALAQVAKQRDAVERRYLAFAGTHAVHIYLKGAAFGTGAVAVVIAVVGLIFYLTDTSAFHWLPVMGAGAVGAVLSVLERNAAGTLNVQVEADQNKLVIGGMSRPAVGMLFGLAVYVLVEARLLPLDIPDSETVSRFYFAGIAFIAGFSERWAKDAIGAAEPPVSP